MSRVRRLGIRGIRNFGPGENEDLQTINFSHPLTLIVGPNGTGKTTIIEALKYATTGEFPPGSGTGKSNSFVHDPLLTNECSVKGLVKAEIVDTKGNYVTVSRRIECTQKQHVKKFQTLDTTLSRVNKDTGEKVAISHRCADVDAEMGLALGVSKPILNHVIFCHQEDSTWPLEDGKKLKERFDQIFDSDKYNKAVEKIRKHNTKLKSDLRVIKEQKEKLKVILEEAKVKRKSLDTFEKRLASSIKKVNEIMERMNPLNEKIKELHNTETDYLNLNAEKVSKKTEFMGLKEQIIELKKNIQILHEGTSDELYKEIAAFDTKISEMEGEMEVLKSKLKDITKEESELKGVISNQQLSIGKLKQQAQAQERNIALRNRNLNEMLTQWGLEGIGAEITETEASVGLDKLERKLFEMEKSIKDKTLEHQTTERQLQKQLDDSRDQKSKLESGMIMLKKQIAEKRKEAGRMRLQVDEVNTLASKLELIDSKLQEANARVDSLAASFDADAMKKEIEDEVKKRDEMELSLDKVNEQVTLLQQQSSLHAELDLLKSSLTAKEKEIQKLKNKHEDNLKMLLNVDVVPETDLKRALNRVQESVSDEIKQLNYKVQKQQRELTSLETTKKHKERELQEKNNELAAIQDEISSICHGKEYDEVLLHAKKTVQDLEDSKGLYAYKSLAYKDYINKTEKCCPLCHRDFENQQEIDEFKLELNEEVNKYPNQLKTYEKQLKDQQKRYHTLLEMKPLVTKAKQLEENTLKNLKNELNELKQKLSESHTQVETLQFQVIEPESKLAQCKDIVGDAALWDQHATEVTKLTQSIARVKGRLSNKVGDKSMQEAQAEQESLRKSLSAIRKNIEKLQSSLTSYNDKLQNSRESRNRLVEQQLKMTSEVQKLKQLQDKLKDLCAEEVSLQESVQDLQKQLGPVNQQCESRDNLLQKTKKEHHEILENERILVAEKSRGLHDLKSIQSEIENCIRRGVVDLLRRSEAEMKKYQKKIEELENNKIKVSTEINEIMNQISKQETRKRDMNDNMLLKQKTAVAEILQDEITVLREKLGNMNYRQLMEEKKKLNEEEQLLIREKNMEQGGQDEIVRNVKLLKAELNKDHYRLAPKNYMNKCAEIVVQEEAIDNLVAYTTALDKAIIEYHVERMDSVNQIILKLWELIYKGKDTTAIQIQTESTAGMGDKRRTYNYKVVQEKQRKIMDMKGRCSAGQKVLASIIIRMALAETFAKNCGIFALDEPTTNLDETNMTSLAGALATIVNLRSKHQKNFQLILISHDEKFVNRLYKVNKIRKVYELFRNDVGLTQIRIRPVDGNAAVAAGGSADTESSDEEADAETEVRSRKRKQLAEERKQMLKNNLAISPPRKKRITKSERQ